jgi:polyisoprenoid-binding protein YceI
MPKLVLLIIACLITRFALADWQLDPAASELMFTTTKKETVVETHQFSQLSGTVTEDGHVRLDVMLTSVDTANPVRDERLKIYLFEVDRFSTASFEANLELDEIFALEEGVSLDFVLGGIISLHGINRPLQTVVSVTRQADNRFLVETTEPISLDAGDFGLSSGLKQLREMADLVSINPAVDVNFKLQFLPQVGS